MASIDVQYKLKMKPNGAHKIANNEKRRNKERNMHNCTSTSMIIAQVTWMLERYGEIFVLNRNFSIHNNL